MRNRVPNDHLKALEDIFGDATSIIIAVAFLKSKGLGKIIQTLTARLKAGAEVEMFVGTDFCQTQPDALKDLLALAKWHPKLKILAAKPDARSTFHPKTYLGVDANTARVMVGSANLTGGALGANEELSFVWQIGLDDPILTELQCVFDGYRVNPRFEVLDEFVLEQYRRRFKEAEDTKKRVEKEMAASESEAFDLSKLSSLHAEFNQDRGEAKALEKRRRDRRSALTVQRRIARMATIEKLSKQDRATFKALFRDLITSGDGHRHLWHSGDIHRRGQAALSKPGSTIALFSLAEVAASLPPEQGYARLRAPAAKIDGVGINMASEILCTFAPKRYAVFNGNTADALRAIGAAPPKTVTLFSPEAYARVCSVVEAVRRRIGGKDLSDADAFLNWIYQTKVKPLAGR